MKDFTVDRAEEKLGGARCDNTGARSSARHPTSTPDRVAGTIHSHLIRLLPNDTTRRAFSRVDSQQVSLTVINFVEYTSRQHIVAR